MAYGRPTLGLISLLLVAACGGEQPAESTTTAAVATTASIATTTTTDGGIAPPELAATAWTVTNYALEGSLTNVWPDTEVTILFGDDGTISGSTGCNEYRGPYTVEGAYDPFEEGVRDENDGQVISLGPLSVTERACAPDHVMDQEAEFLGLLGQTGRWLVARDTLLLRSADGSPLVEAEPIG